MLMKKIAEGKRSVVYIENNKVIKKEREGSKAVNRINNEAYWLNILNKYNIGPKLIKKQDNEITMELIEGKLIIDWLNENERENINKMLAKIIKQCRVLDKLYVNKYELTNPYKHIIISKNKPVMIDFERCKYTEQPKNLTQFCQFISSKKIECILSRKNININKKSLINLLKDYKKNQSEQRFKKILSLFSML